MKHAVRGTRGARRPPRSGYGLVLGCTLLYLAAIVLVPLACVLLKTMSLSWREFWAIATAPRVLASYRITFGASFIAALVNSIFGLIVAWVLVRYRFLGRRLLDAVVDLPFALPTAVAGIALTTIFAPTGWLGRPLAALGVKVAFTPLGVTVALIFIGLPFVVRSVQPVLEDLDPAVEEAAASLGSGTWLTFRRVIFPEIFPALLSGFTLAFARALGEYGSVVFISGNMPMKTEIVPLLIITKLEHYDYLGATALAAVMLIASFLLLFVINGFQWLRRHQRQRVAEAT
jgi:sulfate/thiosulfate transport system permease protein